jgi:2'-5' RNA ligase
VGRFFASFAEAWQFFLARDEPLEDFFAAFPEGESYVLCWLLAFDRDLVPPIRTAQRAFAMLDWVTPQPEHFLHTSIASVSVSSHVPTTDEISSAAERARHAWSGVEPFEVQYRRVNCFHDAAVVEVAGTGPRALVERLVAAGAVDTVDPSVFLAHVTIGMFREPADPSALRDALLPLRELDVGVQRIVGADLCSVPASRTTILTPWTVSERVRFG